MPIDPDMMKAVEAEEERRKLTEPERVSELARVLVEADQPSSDVQLRKDAAATLRALSAELREPVVVNKDSQSNQGDVE